MSLARAETSRSLDLSRARVLLDGVLVGLREVKDPEVPLRAVERHLMASLGALYRALAAAGEPEAFHRQAAISLGRARDALRSLKAARGKDPVVRRHLDALDEVVRGWRDAVMRTSLEPLHLPRPGPHHVPRAQGEVPVLIEMAREPLQPAIVLQWEEPPDSEASSKMPEEKGPVTLAALDALLAQAKAASRTLAAPAKKEEAPAPAAKPRPPVDPDDVERAQFGEKLGREDVELARARSFFEDVAMMSLMRQPDEGDLWSELRPVEERLLARVDGILACGPWVLPELVKLLDERPLPDPEMTWGVLFLHGCLAGDDALHQVERLLRTAGLEVPEVFDAAADALAFVPHPGLEGLLRRWLTGEEALPRRLVARVLGRRGALDGQEALGLAWSDSLELALEGARALPRARGELDLHETARLLRHGHEEVVAGAIEALLLRRSAVGLNHALALLGGGQGTFAGAALWAAIGGTAEARADFEAALKGGVSPAVLEALGWYGNPRRCGVRRWAPGPFPSRVEMIPPELNTRTSATVQLLPRFGLDGAPCIVVVIKQCFSLVRAGHVRREGGARVRLVDEPWEPDAEQSSIRRPADGCLRKPSTDVGRCNGEGRGTRWLCAGWGRSTGWASTRTRRGPSGARRPLEWPRHPSVVPTGRVPPWFR